MFWAHSIFESFALKIGSIRCLPNLSMNKGFKDRVRVLFWSLFLPQNRGKCCPFFKKDFLGPFDLWIFSFKKLGSNRCFPKLSMNKGFKDRLRNCVIYLCFFAFKTGGNAARFSKTFFGPFRSLKFLLLKIGSSMNKGFKDRLRVFVFVFAFTSKQGEMLPVFQKTTFEVHLIFEIFPFKTLGSIRCFPRLSMNKGFKDRLRICVICLCFCFKTGGNAARFSKTFFGPFRSLKFLLLKIGSSMNKGFKDRVWVLFCLCFYLKTGGNAARFSKKTFGSIRSLKCFL